MKVNRRSVLAAFAAVPFAIALPHAGEAQEITVRGVTIRLSERDRAWLKRHCEKKGFAEGSPQYQDCFDNKAREILEQRARDAVYRPSGP
ncbi:MAG: hypothetical protein HQ495_01605 [Alphaproteobacteria bacterium]|nr:hypothetical protein [Alphaproteobacteria bacterium]